MNQEKNAQHIDINNIESGDTDGGDDVERCEDLTESFEHVDQLHPILVRPTPTGAFQVVAGHRRLAAARKLGWQQIWATVVDVDDRAAERISLEENLRRRAVPDEAAQVARLKALYEEDQPTGRGGDRRSVAYRAASGTAPTGATRKVARMTGRSRRAAAREIRIAAAAPQVQVALARRQVTKNEAERLAGLVAEDQGRELEALLARKRSPDAGAERVVAALARTLLLIEGLDEGSISREVRQQLVEAVEKLHAAAVRFDGSDDSRLSEPLQAPTAVDEPIAGLRHAAR